MTKIGITADTHLADKSKHPERYHALENIIETLLKQDIHHLIIAGDVFDENYSNYTAFAQFASAHPEITFHMIPGNHDPLLDRRGIASSNVNVFTEPSLQKLDDSDVHFCFIPYKSEMLMADALQSIDLFPEQWVLIGHADWQTGMKTSNPLEPGVYMPLSRRDIQLFQPMQVFLGHIHKPMDDGSVHYPGSPCGLDITESGIRRFLVFDTMNGNCQTFFVDTDIIYFSETLLIIPVQKEDEYVRSRLAKLKTSWAEQVNDAAKIRFRLKIRGYSSDIKQLHEIIKEELKEYRLYKDEPVDLSEVFLSDDFELQEIASYAAQVVKDIGWRGRLDTVSDEDILFQALKVIYGG